ncbi:PP2C family protein-serine/threonine phosphatase [Pantoea sp. 18069]|uniref:PP2C family protein-serine/threonine phosphatase n=1 Tax=Pantoea sp. 18069 TaxID=2681415 RepID=UPI00135C23BE|nr:PP2C family protein-serine/threonine phosphatase [Pantoea sp. 18069]
MSLRSRIFCALALGIACLGLLCAALVWQTLAYAQQQQARLLLQTQAYAWEQWQGQQIAALQRLAAQLGDGPARALEQRMHAMAKNHPGLRIDLFDENAQRLATTAAGADPEPLLDPFAAAPPAHGLHQLSAREYSWLQRTRVGPQVLVLSQDAVAVVPALAQRLAGPFHILNMRGNPVAGISADEHFFGQVVVPVRDAQVLTLAAGDPRLAGQPALQLVSQPLAGASGGVIGSLVWSRPVSADVLQDRLFAQRVALQAGAVLLLVMGGLFLFLRHALDPLARNVQVLQSLAQGQTDVALYAGEEDAQDESGSVARGVLQIRSELLSLETLRQERVRTRRQQERLIRDQLRSLADSLDPASREEILLALGSQGGAGTPAPGEAPNGLADLAGILGRMSGLVSTQQNRLLKLLREVQASVQTQAMLASLQQELEIAREMQLSILPRQTPNRPEIEIAATMIAAKEIGGDFYDYFAIDDDHLAIVIADVSGKGVPAAFFMAISRTLLKSNGLFLRTPGATIAALNDQLCTENDQMMFVTVFYAVLQLSSGQLTYVNAGHNPPILVQQGIAQFFPKGRNMGLAVLEDQQYHEGTLQLRAGDSLLLYTDGVTEATDAHSALFGDARLLQVVQSFKAQPDRRGEARQLTERIVEEVRHFEAGAAQADDITVVALTYKGGAQ